MRNNRDFTGKFFLGLLVVLAGFAPVDGAHAGFTALYSFTGGSDGADAFGGLIRDGAGNLYGTTYDSADGGDGTVFKLSPEGKLTVLHAFSGIDGAYPDGRLIMDAAGNLYGTTQHGGSYNEGTVFEVAPDGTETVLYSFTGKNDGAWPAAGVLMDGSGNLYGTTTGASGYNSGTVYSLAPNGTLTVLHAFSGGSDGSVPRSDLVRDKKANLYGTTVNGGAFGAGTVFKLTARGTEKVLHSFGSGSDGADPSAGLIRDTQGNLYGTTNTGGKYGNGTVFMVTGGGKETVLYSFKDGSDGGLPYGGVVMDASGDLYGTTSEGGVANCYAGSRCGTVFKLTPGGSESVLHAFTNASDGATPIAGLVLDRRGHLYGTTIGGGKSGYGTIFKLAE